MNNERFQELADAFGGDLSRWPEADRRAAALWLRGSSAAQRIIDDALALDAALDAARAGIDDARADRLFAAIGGRIDALAPAAPRPSAMVAAGRRASRSPLWPAGFLMAMGLLGVVSGALTPSAPAALTSAAASRSETIASIVDVADSTSYYSTRFLVTWAQ